MSVSTSSGVGSSHSHVAASLTFPLFETSLPDVVGPRLLPLKGAFVLESSPFVDKPFIAAFEILVVPRAGVESTFAARDAALTFDHEYNGSAARVFYSSCNGVLSFGISIY